MTGLTFPTGFLWGAATAAYQVEGGNQNSDWWDWERAPGSPVVEPAGTAVEHYTRYPSDIALLAALGLNTYRFSVEWPRIEPVEGEFDQSLQEALNPASAINRARPDAVLVAKLVAPL